MANAVGKPLYVDAVTENKRRLYYARICVEVDAAKLVIQELDVAFKETANSPKSSFKIRVSFLGKA